MPDKEKIIVTKVNKEGVFNFEDFYKFCAKWVKDKGYLLMEERNHEDKEESIKKRIVWVNNKNISDYFRYQMKMEFLTDMKNVKTKKGKKTNKGNVQITIKGILIYDWQIEYGWGADWECSPIKKFLRGIYNKYFIKGRVDKYRKGLKEEVEDFSNQMRSFLNFQKK